MKKGYTLVELLVVIVIIGVLTSIAIVGFGRIQADARDKDRENKASVIAEALEKYYDRNGEYPSVKSIANQPLATVKDKLDITDTSVLLFPKQGNTSTSVADITDAQAAKDKIAYNGFSAGTEFDQCKNKSDGGCNQFSLQWINEDNGEGKIDSRRSGRSADGILNPPKDPIVTISLAGSNVVGTVTFDNSDGQPVCKSGVVSYKIKSSTTPLSDIDWSSVPIWQTSNSLTHPTAAANNSIYYFYAIARCSVADSNAEAINTKVALDDYYYGSIKITAAWSGSSATGTMGTNTPPICGTGLTPKYSIQVKVDGYNAPGSWTVKTTGITTYANGAANEAASWTTSPTYTIPNANDPNNIRKFTFRGMLRCDNGATAGVVSPISNEDILISAPPSPSLSRSQSGTRLTWTWGNTLCPSTTTKLYIGSWQGDFLPKPTINTIVSGQYLDGVYDDGMSYGLGVAASCGSPTSKIMSSSQAVSTRPTVWPYLQAGRGKLYTDYSSGPYASGRTRLQSDSVESPTGTTTACSGASYRALTVNFGRDKTGDDGSGWANYYSGSWGGGDAIIGGPTNLISRNSGRNTTRNTNLEVQTEVYCYNIYYGANPTRRLVDRYGILRIIGNTDSNPKPSRYYVTCTGQSTYVNGVQQGNRAPGHCAGGEGGEGPETLNGQGNAWQQSW